MGYQVENYSLDELHRIAVPGAVAPSLFWALPVGAWHTDELDWMWSWFTNPQRQSMCNDYGLLLVKDTRRRGDAEADVSLASVGAKLSDLMPAGAERFVSPSAYVGKSMRVLVLSGGYPQPGWGVLVEWQERDIHRFEDLIGRTIHQMREANATDELSVFANARHAFRNWRQVNTATPKKPDVSKLTNEIFTAQKVGVSLREAQAALEAGEYHEFSDKFDVAMEWKAKAAWLEIHESTFEYLLNSKQTLVSASSVLDVSGEVLATEIEPVLEVLLADPSARQTVFKNLQSTQSKRALTACLHLRSKGIVTDAGAFQDWARQAQAALATTLKADIDVIREEIRAKLVSHRGVRAQCEEEHQIAVQQWQQKSKEARDTFHLAAGKAVERQWELGPQFLVAFEQTCREQGLWVRSIPWDPARMIGWKLMMSQVRLDSRDLQIAAQELAPDATGASTSNQTPNGVADGSYFTDYVHHIAISKPGFSPRAVTRDLLARLLRPAEMMNLIQAHTAALPKAADASLLAEEVLHAFGWRQSDDAPARPLAGCIKVGSDNAPAISGNLGGNDLRIAAESFCKDVVDVVVSQLGYRHAEVWSAIEERIPNYRPSSPDKDWDEEVRRMTLGSAKMILSALGPLAFSGQTRDVSEFVVDLGKLTDVLNAASHDREGEPVSSEWTIQAPALIGQLLTKAEAFLGDLPWHMEASFVYGEQPKVLSGEAWSHGSPTPRLLRVIVWTGASPGTHVTFWNKERRNPVVPDPVFITRPRKRL